MNFVENWFREKFLKIHCSLLGTFYAEESICYKKQR